MYAVHTRCVMLAIITEALPVPADSAVSATTNLIFLSGVLLRLLTLLKMSSFFAPRNFNVL